jgi:hypothetical protein
LPIRENGEKSVRFCAPMTTTAGSYTIHTEARGPHWIAWLTAGAEAKPERSIVLIAATQEEAEIRARQWVEARGGWGIGQ